MLLRRITRHLNEQNWFAVGIDFIIVVVGVFIGIQVANWNEAKATERKQRAMLEQIYTDFAPRLERWRVGNEAMTSENDANERFVIDRLREGRLADSGKARFDAGLVSLVEQYAVDVSLLQRRMEATELFSAFQGTEFEPILVGLHRVIAVTEAVTVAFENRGHGARDIVFNRIYMDPGPYDAPDPAAFEPVYDFATLTNDQEFIHAVAQLYHYNNTARGRIYSAFLEIRDSINDLEAALYPERARALDAADEHGATP